MENLHTACLKYFSCLFEYSCSPTFIVQLEERKQMTKLSGGSTDKFPTCGFCGGLNAGRS